MILSWKDGRVDLQIHVHDILFLFYFMLVLHVFNFKQHVSVFRS